MRKLLYAVLFLSAILSVNSVIAQELSVESFRPLVNDLTANTFGTIEYDQNGKPAALIKVVLTETGFVFDAGMLGIVKTIEQPGEIWVYVPAGLKHITIAHPDFGILRDYELPVSIERARTYEMRLKAIRPERSSIDLTPTVNVTFDNPAESSGIYLNGAFMGTGSWSGLVAASTFVLEVKQEGFVTYSTTITFDAAKAEQTVTVPPLEPVKGQIMANSNPDGATVFMDGVLKGKSPLLIDSLVAGIYNLEFRLRGFRPLKTTMVIKTDETYKTDAVLKRVNHNVYAGAGYQYGHISGLTAFAGAYFWNYNLEVGYIKHFISSESAYWLTAPDGQKGVSSLIGYDFTLKDVLTGSLGYGIAVGKNFCLTPGLGVAFYRMEGECSYRDSYIADVPDDNFGKASTYTLSGMLQAKAEYSPVKYVSLVLCPSYEIPLSMGSLAADLDEGTDMIQKWCGGFSVKAGVKLYF